MRTFSNSFIASVISVACLVGCKDAGEGGEGDWDSSGEGSARTPGTLVSSTQPLPAGMTTAGEAPWTIRLLSYHPGPVVPRRMYFASCTPPGGAPKLLVSVSLQPETATDQPPIVTGAVFEAQLDATTGALKPTGAERAFPECREMHGIAAKSDCSVIGVLCRRASRASETEPATKDMVAALTDTSMRDWMTQPGTPEQGEQRNDEEWLYEWTDGTFASTPSTYVAHKAIGGWVFGSQYLVYGESDDTFGLSLKATVYGGGNWHEGDAMLIVDRRDHSISQNRGWFWGCAAGHTLFNHPTFNPATSQYAVTCGTDLGVKPDAGGGFGGIWTHTEKGSAQGYLDVPIHDSLSIGGGPTSLLPLPDGGYIGVFAGVNGSISKNQDFQARGAVTEIGFARFDGNGVLVGAVKRVAAMPGVFLSYPQLAPLGNGEYLLGYGEMVPLKDQNDWNLLRVPGAYHVQEIDENGTPLTAVQTLDGVGWGEQDQMVPLGNGRVGWGYIAKPARVGTALPPWAAKQLSLTVYTR